MPKVAEPSEGGDAADNEGEGEVYVEVDTRSRAVVAVSVDDENACYNKRAMAGAISTVSRTTLARARRIAEDAEWPAWELG